jgi:hypothetical protein
MAKVVIAQARIGKNICEYTCDVEQVTARLQDLSTDYDEDEQYVRLETEDELTKEQYFEELTSFIASFSEMTTIEYAKDVLNNYPLKKNGTYYKGRIYKRVRFDACYFFQEWHNTWEYETLTIKAISDTEIELTIQRVTDTPG